MAASAVVQRPVAAVLREFSRIEGAATVGTGSDLPCPAYPHTVRMRSCDGPLRTQFHQPQAASALIDGSLWLLDVAHLARPGQPT